MKHKMVEETLLKEVVGHAVQGETMGRYGKRYTPEILLKEAIEKIDYGLDLKAQAIRDWGEGQLS
jgi:hypothetical protein